MRIEALKICSLTVVIALASTLAGRAQERFVFMPQWKAQAQFAGYYVAQEKGFYKEAGIDVDIVHPSLTQPVMSRILNNGCQATTLSLCQALEVIDNGVPLVNILQTSMNSAMVIVSAHNVNPFTQKGARVGIWSSGYGQLAECMSKKEGLNYQWIPAANSVNLFVAGAVDAIVAMNYNEYYQLIQAGKQLSEKNVYRFCDHGYNIQDEGVYMTYDYYVKHKEQAHRFAEASQRGWEWAAAHPDETKLIISKYVKANRSATNSEIQTLMLKEVLQLQIDRESGKREFRLRPDMVKRASQLMLEGGMLKREIRYEELVER